MLFLHFLFNLMIIAFSVKYGETFFKHAAFSNFQDQDGIRRTLIQNHNTLIIKYVLCANFPNCRQKVNLLSYITENQMR